MSHTPARSFELSIRTASIRFALAALGTASVVHAQPVPRVIYVDAAAPAGGNGNLWTSALRDLQDALFIATFRPDRTVPVQIKIAQGVYTPDSGTLNRNASFVVNSAVSLLGGFAGLAGSNPAENDPSRFATVLSGDLWRNDSPGVSARMDNSYLVLKVESQPGTIDGISIRGGIRAVSRSGYGALSMSRCMFDDNISSFPVNIGGVMGPILSLSEATLVECTIADNYAAETEVLRAVNCTFQRCRIVGNRFVPSTIVSGLPALISVSAPVVFDSCLIAANTSSSVNIQFVGESIGFYSTTFADNTAAFGPVVSYSYYGSASFYNCILARNTSTESTVPQHQIAGGHVTLDSCFIQRGTADLWNNGGISVTTRIVSGNPGFINPAGPDGDPFAWRDNNYQLSAMSPCMDRGTTFPLLYLASHTDIRGQAVVDSPTSPNLGVGPISYLDLGCFEYIPYPCRADFNTSGALSPQDIFDFLGAWFALSPAADFNSSGTITAQDIFDFLGAWFAGC